MDIALTAAETGHVVYSTLHTISAAQTINRVLGMFSQEEENRCANAWLKRCVMSSASGWPETGRGRLLITELMGSSLRTREAIALGESENRRLNDVIEAGSTAGWHTFEQSLTKAYEDELITEETALLYCVSRNAMAQRIDIINKSRETSPAGVTLKMKGPNARAPGSADPIPMALAGTAKSGTAKIPA